MKISAVVRGGLSVALVLVVGCMDMTGSETQEAEQELWDHGPNPVVFAHGCYPGPPVAPPPYTNESAAQFWGPMHGAFIQMGYDPSEVSVWVYEGDVCASNFDMAISLAKHVHKVRRETGSFRVDLVTHSMGGLLSRLYVKFGGRIFVDDFVIINGSNHGAGSAQFGEQWHAQFGGDSYIGATEMFPPYACGDESVNSVQALLNGCLTPEGRTAWADETPGYFVDYLNLYISNDEANIPNHVSCLNQEFLGDCSDPVNVQFDHVQPNPDLGIPAHTTTLFDPIIIQTVFDHMTPSVAD